LRFGTFSPPASHLASAAASWEEAVQARGPPLAVAHVPRLATALAGGADEGGTGCTCRCGSGAG